MKGVVGSGKGKLEGILRKGGQIIKVRVAEKKKRERVVNTETSPQVGTGPCVGGYKGS